MLETVLERLLSAWVAASTGRASELPALATGAAAERLLHPAEAPAAQIVVHDLALVSFAPDRLEHAGATTLTLELEVAGIRYVATRTIPAARRQPDPVGRDALHVDLALVRDDGVVWRLDDAGDVAPRLYLLPD